MKNAGEVVTPGAGAVVRQDFGGKSMEVRAETASAAIAAQAQAAVQARYIMALQRPRDWDVVRQRLLKECERPGFAEVARYRKPVGKDGVEGLSIRFAEAALRCMTNCWPEVSVIYEDAEKRIVRVALTDLEANLTYSKDIVVEKVVERSKPKEGQAILSERVNSYGKKTFLVSATEDELLNKQAALESKALRTHTLRVLPGDISDEAEARILLTLQQRAQKDPGAERKRIIDGFAGVGVPVEELKTYVGKPLDQLSPAELVELRAVYASVRDGEASWRDLLEHRTGKAQKPSAPPVPGQQEASTPEAPASAPSEEPKPNPVTGEVPMTPEELLNAEIAALARDIAALKDRKAADALAPRVAKMPKGHPKRDELGKALNLKRRELGGGP